MQKAHLYEAILLVNSRIDDAVRGLERLKRAKDSGLRVPYIDEKLTLLEMHPALFNGFFCNNIKISEQQDELRFSKLHCIHERRILDEVQVYRHVQAVEEARRLEGKAPKLRFLTSEKQLTWERQYPKPPVDLGDEGQRSEGGQK